MATKKRDKADPEVKQLLALAQRIAKRLRRQGVAMTFEVKFGPLRDAHNGKEAR